MQPVLERDSIDNPLTFDVGLIHSVSYQCVHLIHATFQSNCTEDMHFSAFRCYCCNVLLYGALIIPIDSLVLSVIFLTAVLELWDNCRD